mmetsp:Transcript_710/g.2098  ORF Transcript_710/g.2098 Transcript_710/m.2098 type:complete len:255 (-) Transcript_710:2350-3114(-)
MQRLLCVPGAHHSLLQVPGTGFDASVDLHILAHLLPCHRRPRPRLCLDGCQRLLTPGEGLGGLGGGLLGVELQEAALQHVLYLEVLHTEEVEDHGVGEPELGLQQGGRPGEQLLELRLVGDVVPAGDDDGAHGVQAPPPRPPRHLRVLPRQQVPEAFAIVLSDGLEDDGAGGGVDPHGEGLRAEQHLKQAPAEQHLHNLLHDRQQPCMMYSQATAQERLEALDLGQPPVLRPQSCQRLVAEHLDVGLVLGGGEV